MVFYALLEANKYMEDNYILHYLLIQKQKQEHYFVVEEHYEEYHSHVNKCLMLYLISLILLGVLGHNTSYI